MLDDELKESRKKLEAAINEALTESSQINAAIQEIRAEGYEVFLIIEATIGFNRREEVLNRSTKALPAVRLNLTTQDQKFLKSLKISPE